MQHGDQETGSHVMYVQPQVRLSIITGMPMDLPNLPQGTLLLVEVGSTAHGTGDPGTEDHDETAVVVETPEQAIMPSMALKNAMHRTQPEGVQSGPGDTDRNVYSLRNFLELALKGNPSVMLALWAPVIKRCEHGRQLQDLGAHFVSRHMIPQYRGYMKSQVERLLGTRGGGHGKRGGGGRPEIIEKYGWDTKYAMHATRLGLQCIELLSTARLELPIPSPTGDYLRDIRQGRVSFDDWFEQILLIDQQVAFFASDTSIPPRPNFGVIAEWAIHVHLQFWQAPARPGFLLKDKDGNYDGL